jgi:rhodanese-related sulfurtransferase
MFAPQVPSVQVTDLDPAVPVPPGTVLLDVREKDEWDAGHVPDAVHIPLADLPQRVDELDRDARIVVVCHAGVRSARATAWLVQGGFDAVNLDGGMVDWARAGLPVV